MKTEKSKNFFKVSHLFEEKYGEHLNISTKYFFVILLKLENRFANKDGWFWYEDKDFVTKKTKVVRGFRVHGFSSSTCKRARKVLINMELVKTKPGRYKNGHRSGTYYQVNHELLKNPRDQDDLPIV